MSAKYYYVGITLDIEDQVKLLEMYPPPVSWIPAATHMTISLQPLTSASPVRLGQRIPLTLLQFGKNEHSQAVKVKVRSFSPWEFLMFPKFFSFFFSMIFLLLVTSLTLPFPTLPTHLPRTATISKPGKTSPQQLSTEPSLNGPNTNLKIEQKPLKSIKKRKPLLKSFLTLKNKETMIFSLKLFT
jgi:hypothetical protein